MKFKSLLLVVFFMLLQAAGSTSGQVIQAGMRQTTSLNGKWQIIVDPYDNGYVDYQMRTHESEGYFKNAKPKDKTDRIEYTFSQQNALDVPGDWNSQRDRLYYYEGSVWYKRDFQYVLNPGNRLFVRFGAVNYHCHVYLNGRKIGEHIGGFTPFAIEITDFIADEGENFLIVMVNNSRHRDAVPTVNTDWWNYGGLTRDVALIEVPAVFIEDYFIQLGKGEPDCVRGWIQSSERSKDREITVQIPELALDETVYTDKNGLARLACSCKPERWSPEAPKLYTVRILSGDDTVEDRIGFRTIETEGDKILLNGQPVFLRGICIHEEAPIRGGRAFSKEDALLLLNWAKELGCNFVRLAHYPHNEYMVRLADEMGLMVWSEIPVYWTIAFDNSKTLQNAGHQLTENILRDKNRASVILWSIGNETPVHRDRNHFMKNLAERARQLDPTRLLTAATDKQSTDGYHYVISDPLIEYLDVIGVNEYIGWYDGLPEKCDRITWTSKFNKPVIISETGGGALFGLHGDERTRWSEEYQASLYRHQINMIRKIPSLSGITPWILMDFRSPRRPLPGIQDGWNRKGLISNRGEYKKAFYVLKDYYEKIKKIELFIR